MLDVKCPNNYGLNNPQEGAINAALIPSK